MQTRAPSGGRGLKATLQALVQDRRPWVSSGQVIAVESSEAYGLVALVAVQPGQALQIECRIMWPGTAARGGMLYPVEAGDEVVVLMPDTGDGPDINQAIAIAGLTSRPQRLPTGWNNDHVALQHPGGVEARATDGAPVEAVVLASLLQDLALALPEIIAGLTANALPSTHTTQLLNRIGAGNYRATALRSE